MVREHNGGGKYLDRVVNGSDPDKTLNTIYTMDWDGFSGISLATDIYI